MCVCVCVCVCVCLYVCMYVCLSERAILEVHAIISITKDVIVLSVKFYGTIKKVFFLKLSYSKVNVFFTHLASDGHL